jgi:hypothetical protein
MVMESLAYVLRVYSLVVVTSIVTSAARAELARRLRKTGRRILMVVVWIKIEGRVGRDYEMSRCVVGVWSC